MEKLKIFAEETSFLAGWCCPIGHVEAQIWFSMFFSLSSASPLQVWHWKDFPWLLLMGWLEQQLSRNQPWKQEKCVSTHSSADIAGGRCKIKSFGESENVDFKVRVRRHKLMNTYKHLRPIKFTDKGNEEWQFRCAGITLATSHQINIILLNVSTKLRKCAPFQRAMARNTTF